MRLRQPEAKIVASENAVETTRGLLVVNEWSIHGDETERRSVEQDYKDDNAPGQAELITDNELIEKGIGHGQRVPAWPIHRPDLNSDQMCSPAFGWRSGFGVRLGL